MEVGCYKQTSESMLRLTIFIYHLDKQLLLNFSCSLQRLSFGYAHKLHLYSDYKILVSDFLSHGTLQVSLENFVVYIPFAGLNAKNSNVLSFVHIIASLHSFFILHHCTFNFFYFQTLLLGHCP